MTNRVEVKYTAGPNAHVTDSRFYDPVDGCIYNSVVGGSVMSAGYRPEGRPGEYRTDGTSVIVDILYLCQCAAKSIHDCPAACPVPGAQDIKNLHLAEAPKVFDASKEGRKNGKIRMELVFEGMPNALRELGRCMTWAIEAKGYSELDFLTVPNGTQKYRGAMYRHDQKEVLGEEFDDESGLIHATHTAWNALARLELLLRKGNAQ